MYVKATVILRLRDFILIQLRLNNLPSTMWGSRSIYVVIAVLACIVVCEGGVTSSYRRKLAATLDMPLDVDVFKVPDGFNAPQQVHITQGDLDGRGVIISWVTPSRPGSNTVWYGLEKGKYVKSSEGKFLQYKFYNYTSGFIHHCVIKNLEYNTKYYYRLGEGGSAREFWFWTPPSVNPDAAYTFGIIGDLGQTFDSNKTLQHYMEGKGQTVLFVGDLSYADNYPNHDNRRWDTWGRFVESSTAYQPWIWTAGNHELDFVPELGETTPFKPYLSRFHVPYHASNSTSPLWYSIKRASAYIIVLSSYSAYGITLISYHQMGSKFFFIPSFRSCTSDNWAVLIQSIGLNEEDDISRYFTELHGNIIFKISYYVLGFSCVAYSVLY
ncbi:hypothetical protein KP509_38G047600 [Ceratopteris richardii]|uniref:Purple acid phosphatase n=1 Tax=Ceratopteris richardii TaxID=49495 RepID=A0A8T2Q4L4_CERRI|nr:hypothetical protein KP509_38G047600 [Ceratopteris richardii]